MVTQDPKTSGHKVDHIHFSELMATNIGRLIMELICMAFNSVKAVVKFLISKNSVEALVEDFAMTKSINRKL